MSFGPAGAEKVVLNIDSLWSGGPFESSVSWYYLLQESVLILATRSTLVETHQPPSVGTCTESETGFLRMAQGVSFPVSDATRVVDLIRLRRLLPSWK